MPQRWAPIDTAFRTELRMLGLDYVVGVQSSTMIWPPGQGPLPPKPWSGTGRPPTVLRRDAGHMPLSDKTLAISLPTDAWEQITWREGTHAPLVSRFAAVRVRPAHRDHKLTEPRPEEWLLIEWPEGEAEPSKSWLSSLPATSPPAELVDTAKLRWWIERDDQELKQEFGLGHDEGRGWRGFRHHVTLCIAAYGFPVSGRGRISPSGPGVPTLPQAPAIPADFRPRGAPGPGPAEPRRLDRHAAHLSRPGALATPAAVPRLPKIERAICDIVRVGSRQTERNGRSRKSEHSCSAGDGLAPF